MDLRVLTQRLEARRQYPKDLGYSPTAIGHGGSWRQGYEAAIDDALALLREFELDEDLKENSSSTPWAV